MLKTFLQIFCNAWEGYHYWYLSTLVYLQGSAHLPTTSSQDSYYPHQTQPLAGLGQMGPSGALRSARGHPAQLRAFGYRP